MKNAAISAVFLFAASALASEPGRVTLIPGAPNQIAFSTASRVTATSPLSLRRVLDKKGKDIIEFWYTSRDGQKQKRYCEPSCTYDAYNAFAACTANGGGHDPCCYQWQQAIVYCCDAPPDHCECPDGWPMTVCN